MVISVTFSTQKGKVHNIWQKSNNQQNHFGGWRYAKTSPCYFIGTGRCIFQFCDMKRTAELLNVVKSGGRRPLFPGVVNQRRRMEIGWCSTSQEANFFLIQYTLLDLYFYAKFFIFHKCFIVFPFKKILQLYSLKINN